MSLFKERLAKNHATPVYLVEVTAGDMLKTWQKVAGYSYPAFEINYLFRPSELRCDGELICNAQTELGAGADPEQAVDFLDADTAATSGYSKKGIWIQQAGKLFLMLRWYGSVEVLGGGATDTNEWARVAADGSDEPAFVKAFSGTPTDLKVDGISLHLADTQAHAIDWVNDTTQADQGAWAKDTVNSTLFFILRSAVIRKSPWASTVQSIVPFYFSTHPKVFNDHYYEPRVLSLPNLSLRVEAHFGGVSQIGGGSLNLNNRDGVFSGLQHFNWDYGRTVLRAGIDLPSDPMAYADYQIFGSWLNDGYDCNGESLSLKLTEQKVRLQKKIPSTLYGRTDFPGIDNKMIGKPIAIAYGAVKGVTPVAISGTPGFVTFKVASHPITSLDRIRKKSGDEWISVSQVFLPDLSNAIFTLSVADASLPLSVDFVGKATSTGYLDNAADVVKDILASVGETEIGPVSFAESKSRLDLGTDSFTGQKVYRSPLSLYLNEQVTALDVLGKINEAVGSYLYVGLDGKYHYRVFQPLAGDAALGTDDELPVLTEEIIQSFDMTIDTDVISQVMATYDERNAEEAVSTYEEHRDSVLLTHGLAPGAHKTESGELPYTDGKDAAYWVERTLVMRSVPARTISVSLHWTGILYEPTSQVIVRYKKHGYDIDDVFEVLEQSIDLKSNSVKLALGDRHGFQRVGHWSLPEYTAISVEGAAPTKLPIQFSALVGYDDGIATTWKTAWASEIKEWARRHVSYAVDGDGFAYTGDPDSYNLPPLLPERFQGAGGYENGSASSWKKEWAPEIKAWARQNLAFWCDENGFAKSDDPESYMLTRWF